MVVFGQKGCILAKVAVIEHKRLYSGKVVVFGQKWFTRVKLVKFGKKRMYSGKGGKKCCIRAKVVLFGQGEYIP